MTENTNTAGCCFPARADRGSAAADGLLASALRSTPFENATEVRSSLGSSPAGASPPGALYLRRLPSGPRSFDREARTCIATIASGTPVRRPPPCPDGELTPWDEILEISARAVDVAAIAGAPVLMAHNLSERAAHVGVVEQAWIENGSIVARLRFSKRAEVEPVLQDVSDSILQQTSAGYVVSAWRREPGAVPRFVATKYQILETSLLPLGADSLCRIRGFFAEKEAP